MMKNVVTIDGGIVGLAVAACHILRETARMMDDEERVQRARRASAQGDRPPFVAGITFDSL